MDHDLSARPTLRLLTEDLHTEWRDPAQFRAARDHRWPDLQPLTSVAHPVVEKCRDSLGDAVEHEALLSPIKCSTEIPLLEVRTGHWRAGVWIDPDTGVPWICVAGLAKGNHEDHDDFYQSLARTVDAGSSASLLPTETDKKLLLRETMSRVMLDWELAAQASLLAMLQAALAAGTATTVVPHPLRNEPLAEIKISIDTDDSAGYETEDLVVDIQLGRFRGSDLGWQLTTRTLTAISPPTQGWDRYGDTYSTIGTPGTAAENTARLATAVANGLLVEPELGAVSHYAHRRHIGEASVHGTAVRALCGRYFVPTQDHRSMPVCPHCEERLEQLPP